MFMTPLTNSQIEMYNAKGGANAGSTDPQEAQDRFLKLLTTQLANQDPLNPMDNAQMTSQMAQINTVTGIQQLNQTLKGMSAQFGALQGMQGVSLVGRQAVVKGNQLTYEGDVGRGAMSLSGDATSVRVDILGRAGQLLDSVELGARKAGLNTFDWNATGINRDDVAGFSVSATRSGEPVTAETLARQRIEAVSLVDGSLRLRSESGQTLNYNDVLLFL